MERETQQVRAAVRILQQQCCVQDEHVSHAGEMIIQYV